MIGLYKWNTNQWIAYVGNPLDVQRQFTGKEIRWLKISLKFFLAMLSFYAENLNDKVKIGLWTK